jgi:hypothetical protein
VFWIGDQRDNLSASNEKIAKLEPQILDRERKDKAEALNEPLRVRLAGFVQTQQLAMVTGDLFSWAVRELTLFAERHPAVQMVNVRAGQKQFHPTMTNYEVYNVQVELRGKYDDLGHFLSGLENAFPTAQLRTFDLSPGDATSLTRNATLDIGFMIWPETATAWISSKEEPKKP